MSVKRGRPHGQSDFLEAAELRQLVNLPDRRTKEGLRDYAVLVLLANTPLRKGEIAMLKRGNMVNTGTQTFIHYVVEKKRKVRGKGQEKHRVIENTVPLRKETYEAIIKYHEAEFKGTDADQDNPLFMTLGKHGNCVKQAITAKAIDYIVSKYAQLSGINKRITPHSFRASFATHALDKGADLKTVSELLGHASILSTQPYLRSNIERKQKAIECFSFV